MTPIQFLQYLHELPYKGAHYKKVTLPFLAKACHLSLRETLLALDGGGLDGYRFVLSRCFDRCGGNAVVEMKDEYNLGNVKRSVVAEGVGHALVSECLDDSVDSLLSSYERFVESGTCSFNEGKWGPFSPDDTKLIEAAKAATLGDTPRRDGRVKH